MPKDTASLQVSAAGLENRPVGDRIGDAHGRDRLGSIGMVSLETCRPEGYGPAEIDRQRPTCRPVSTFFFHRSRIGTLVHQGDTQTLIGEQPGQEEAGMAGPDQDAVEEAA